MEKEPVIYQWHFDPSVLLLSMVIVYFYYRISTVRPRKKMICFWSAISIFIGVECSPLHDLGMHYYFSAHMITHVILLLICGPLLVLSIPSRISSPSIKAIQRLSVVFAKHNWLAWLSGVGIMWFWHIPVVFDASFSAMDSSFSLINLLQMSSMLIAGICFSWPLVGPIKSERIHPLLGIVYLFTACISCSLLGLLITFAPINVFHHYNKMGASMDMHAINPWGISPEVDQQAAGLIMWVPCCFVYLGACIYLLQQWFREVDRPVNHKLVNLNVTTIDHGGRKS
ncbi:MAG: cytochrome c oxidase assembly protein [Candidatus Pedobacter colombiensis]|uniref:Cytochrome c oxidase assembly protein n=1 Tax=Candidatus Pedobacter colombiensis TaxID=3121371 RepID=A0AAJ5WA14_9SPHI|nr:cytochrome c oxidase assembly protein [Pedobacter sp.]WEK21578.1 MAG: cytochrome c oxidase assembly protein [Pedobacter sp.]